MKKTLFTIVFITGILAAQAQNSDEDIKKQLAARTKSKELKDTGWIRGGFVTANLSNATFSNWAQGGTNNTALIATASFFAIYNSKSGKDIWENYLNLAYGITRIGKSRIEDPDDKTKMVDNPFVKNEDKFVFLSKYGRKISDKLNYSALFTLNTQMAPGWGPKDVLRRDNHVSNFMAPGFGYVSVGLDYKPRSWVSIYFSPLTAKYTIVREQRLADMGLYGVRPAEYNDFSDTIGGKPPRMTRHGQKFRTEFGWYVNISVLKDIAKNMNFQSMLEIFQNYKTMTVKQTDLNWQSTLNMKVNKYITVVLIYQMMWDYDVDTRSEEVGMQRNWQIKNFFGVGFSAKFGDQLD